MHDEQLAADILDSLAFYGNLPETVPHAAKKEAWALSVIGTESNLRSTGLP